jgi:HEAT repeat protein
MEDRVDHWLRLLGGPDWEGPEARDDAIREMRGLGTATAFPLLVRKLSDTDLETRCAAIEAVGLVDAASAVEFLVPLLRDPDVVVRLCACEALSSPHAVAAVEPLIGVLRGDPDPQVRNYAASALGHISSRAAIPALLLAMDRDHEPDMHGHTPAHCAAMALDDLLGTNYTRIRLSESLCTMRPGPPDLDGLRKRAMQEYGERESK